jgi:hypothetical protein
VQAKLTYQSQIPPPFPVESWHAECGDPFQKYSSLPSKGIVTMDIIEAIALALQGDFWLACETIPQPGQTLWLDGPLHPRSAEEDWIRAEFELHNFSEGNGRTPTSQFIAWC